MCRITELSQEDLTNLIANSKTYSEVLRKLGLCESGGNSSRALKRRIKEWAISTSHFGVKRQNLHQRFSDDEIFCEDSKYKGSSTALKSRLLSAGLLKYECVICGLRDTWNSLRLVLQLDHIDGDNSDNSISNLRFLCPNCHSQTATFAGKNK